MALPQSAFLLPVFNPGCLRRLVLVVGLLTPALACAGSDAADYTLPSWLLVAALTAACVVQASLGWRFRSREKRLIDDLANAEVRLSEAQEIARMGSWTRDFATGETFWSPQARKVLMLDDRKAFPHYERLVHPEDHARVIETIASAYHQGGAYQCDHRIVCPSGVHKYIRLAGKVFLDPEKGGPVREHGTVQDITHVKLAEQEAVRNEERMRSILDAAPYPIIIISLEHEAWPVRFANPSTFELFDISDDSQDLSALEVDNLWVSRESRKQFADKIGIHRQLMGFDALLRKQSGAIFWASINATRMNFGGEEAMFVSVIDVSEKKALEEELERLASTDPLTGVLNRRAFAEVAKKEIRRAVRYNQPVCACLIDLDDFKSLNDRYGHAFGDLVLQRFIEVTRSCLRIEDVMGRLGGEEFAAVLVGADAESGRMVAERILRKWSEEKLEIDNEVIGFGASIGMTALEQPRESLEELLVRAGRAQHHAKERGGNCVVLLEGSARHEARDPLP